MNNPLLKSNELPPFSHILPEHVRPAIESIVADNEQAIAALLASGKGKDWTSLQEPLDALDDRLSQAWSPVGHMNAVVNSEDLRAVYNDCLPLLSEYSTRIGQNRQLFDAYQALADSAEFGQLNSAQQKVINDSK